MTNLMTMTCPSCGGKLQITTKIEQFTCSFCGNEHIVKRSGGIVLLAPVIESIGKVQTGVDKTASELAIRRLREDISSLKIRLEETIESRGKNMVFGVIIMIVGCILSLSFFDGANTLGLLGLLCIAIGVSMMVNGLKKSDKEKKIERVLREKQLQIDQHETVVGR